MHMANWARLFCLYIIEQQLFHSKKVFKSFVLYRPIARFKQYISFTLDCTLQSLLIVFDSIIPHSPPFRSLVKVLKISFGGSEGKIRVALYYLFLMHICIYVCIYKYIYIYIFFSLIDYWVLVDSSILFMLPPASHRVAFLNIACRNKTPALSSSSLLVHGQNCTN